MSIFRDLLIILFLYYIIGSGISYFLIGDVSEETALWHLITILLFQGMFIGFPAIFLAYRIQEDGDPSKKKEALITFFGLKKIPSVYQCFLSIIAMLIFLPIVSLGVHLQYLVYEYIGELDFVSSYIKDYESNIETLLISGGSFHILFGFIIISVVPAICEELLFRGYIQERLARRFSLWTTVILSGVIFGVFHINPVHTLGLILIGTFISWLKAMSGSIFLPMVVHFFNNAVMGMMLILNPNLEFVDIDFSSASSFTPEAAIFYITMLALFLITVHFLGKSFLNNLKENGHE